VATIEAAAADCDIVVTTGGTAAGPVDHLHPAIAALGGSFVVDAVAVRPGHPMALADLGSGRRARWLLGLPGNPQSAVVSLLTLGQPLIDSLLGVPEHPLATIALDAAAPAPDREHRLLACSRRGDRAAPAAHLGSAMLRGLAQSDGFAVLPPGGAAAGQEVPWLPLP
jgi:molybdopterin molybdotransferase